MALNEQLQQALDSVGDTPLKERELYKILIDPLVKKSIAIKLVLQRVNMDMSQFSGMELAQFFRELNTKVTDLRYPDKSFKTTPATENCDLPTFEEAEAIGEAGAEYAMAKSKLELASKSDPDAVTAAISEYSEALRKLQDVAWPVSGINRDHLDPEEDFRRWEEELVLAQVLSATNDIVNTALGKD